MTGDVLNLKHLPQLEPLFRWFSSGKHLNREAEPALWAELEREQAAYLNLFSALGFDLQIDGRGFAWFQTDDVTSNVNKTTRQLALLFMVLFDTQADAGKPLMRFGDWVIDQALLATVYEQHQDLLEAESLDREALKSLLDTAVRQGFAQQEGGYWRLLPAVCRYLDHIEELAQHIQDDESEWLDDVISPEDDV